MSELVKYQAKDGQEVELTFEKIKKYLVSGKPEFVTKQEMIYFIMICKARGLNPFAKDCYLIKYTESDPAAIIVSIDFFRSRAKAQPDCRGWESGVITKQKDGTLRYSKGLVLEDETLLGGWFCARPEGWDRDFELEVNLSGYIKKTNKGYETAFWKPEKQATMIRKVAESQGLREVWPAEFGKMYVHEEIDRTQIMDEAETIARNANQESIDIEPVPDKDPKPKVEEKKPAPEKEEPQGETDEALEGIINGDEPRKAAGGRPSY